MKYWGVCATLVAILVVTTSTSVEGAAAPERRKVLILGAGIAGISAAKTLKKKGIEDFLVLEAQDYIGGRIKSIPFAGVKIEDGANWIHYYDENPNPIRTLQKRQGYPGTMSNFSDMVMRWERSGYCVLIINFMYHTRNWQQFNMISWNYIVCVEGFIIFSYSIKKC